MAQDHWDSVWASRRPEEVSWYQASPDLSLRLIERVTDPTAGVVDVGGGASRVVDGLLDAGYTDLTVVDIAPAALEAARRRLGGRASEVTWVQADVTALDAGRRFDLWHDRAVLHFLTEEEDRDRYTATLGRSLAPGGHVVLATFGPTGPERCSGLPVRRYGPEDMVALLGDRFALVEYTEELHETPAGADQAFVYGLFRSRAGSDDR